VRRWYGRKQAVCTASADPRAGCLRPALALSGCTNLGYTHSPAMPATRRRRHYQLPPGHASGPRGDQRASKHRRGRHASTAPHSWHQQRRHSSPICKHMHGRLCSASWPAGTARPTPAASTSSCCRSDRGAPPRPVAGHGAIQLLPAPAPCQHTRQPPPSQHAQEALPAAPRGQRCQSSNPAHSRPADTDST
jgi:hypothetical protein